MTTIACERCEKLVERHPMAHTQKYCKPCAKEVRRQTKSDHQRTHQTSDYRLDPVFDREKLAYEIAETTEQFNRGAKFSVLEVKLMCEMGTILEGTKLQRDDKRYVTIEGVRVSDETGLNVMVLIDAV